MRGGPVRTGEHDEDRQRGALGEGGLLVRDEGGLRRCREERRVVVRGDLAELAREGSGDAADEQPADGHGHGEPHRLASRTAASDRTGVGSGAHADSVSESSFRRKSDTPGKLIDSSTTPEDTGSVTDWTPADGPMPALYLGHGAPPLLDDALWTAELSAWAASLPRPRAILIVSAHWETAPISLSATGSRHPARLRLRRLRPQVLRDDVPDPRCLGTRRARHVDAPGHRAGAPARQPRARPRRVGAAQGHVPRRRHPGAAAVPSDLRSAAAARARCAPATAARPRRARDRLRLPHARTALPAGLEPAGEAAGLERRLRPLGRRGARPRRRRHPRRLPQPGAGDAVRAPDRRALRAALHHPRRCGRSDAHRRRPRSTATSSDWRRGPSRSPDHARGIAPRRQHASRVRAT